MVRIKNPDTGIEWEDERCACSACTRNVASKEGILSPGRHTPVMASVRTPWAVYCRCSQHEEGLIFLTSHGYNMQMSNPDALWRCPSCGEEGSWDDDNYEAYEETLQALMGREDGAA
jgi:predicted RNA-binding Zn-ribbon protein involved in translation (DUF1610 family)